MPPDSHGCIRAALFLDKGGVGKTTATAHLGVALAEYGYDILLVDLAGKQNDLAKQFGLYGALQDDPWPNISTTLQDQWDQVAV